MVRSEDDFHVAPTTGLLPISYPFLASLNRRSEGKATLLEKAQWVHMHTGKTWYRMIEAQSATQALPSSIQPA